jgi:hypothetical protein
VLESDPQRHHAEPDLSDSAHAAWPRLDSPNELIQRLRVLRWPAVSPEARQRCWMTIAPQIEAFAEGDVHAARRTKGG